MKAPIQFLSNRVLVIFGRYSYGIYLSHIFVISLAWKIWENIFGRAMIGQMIVYCILQCISSLAVGISVEKIYGTVQQLLVRWMKRKNDNSKLCT